MTLSKADLVDLKWGIGAFLLSLALGGGIIAISNDYQETSRKDRQTAQKQLAEARTQLSAAQNDQENMASYALEYNALLAQQVIGDEHRLDWIEGLEKLRLQGHVLDFKYAIAPQQNYAPNPPLDAGSLQLNRSGMTMQMDLLHEEQLLHLLTAMRTQMQGWFMLDGCSLSRTGDNDETSPLRAECTGGWFTMKNRNAP